MTNLCPYCFAEAGLRRRLIEVRPKFDEGACDNHPKRKGIPIEAVAEIVDEVFRENFTFGDADFYPGDDEEPPFYGRQRGDDLETVIANMTRPETDDIGRALVAQLIEDDDYWPPKGEEPFYQEDQLYERITGDDHGHGAMWERFCEAVTHEQRFMNAEGAELLGEIFRHIHLQRDEDRNPPVYVLKPDASLRIFRARVAPNDKLRTIQSDPEGQLGPPPGRLGKPNRMNPSGISALYGAFDLATCVSELRPLVGDQVVAAEFELLRELVVLDTTRFAAPAKELNLFARDHVRRLAQWRFMQRFMAEIARPISPDDAHLDYVPTQVVAEYLSRVHEVSIGRNKRRIDAIIYQSAQRPAGRNIVLLGQASIVRRPAPPPEPSIFPNLRIKAPEPTLAYVEGSLRSLEVRAAEFQIQHELPLRRISPSEAVSVFPDLEDLSDLGPPEG